MSNADAGLMLLVSALVSLEWWVLLTCAQERRIRWVDIAVVNALFAAAMVIQFGMVG